MKLSDTIKNLRSVLEEYGDITVQLQNNPSQDSKIKGIIGYESFFVVPEEYYKDDGDDKEYICNIRSWPY